MTQTQPLIDALAKVTVACPCAKWAPSKPGTSECVAQGACGMCWTSGYHDLPHCEPCNGTGTVARYPGLTEEACPGVWCVLCTSETDHTPAEHKAQTHPVSGGLLCGCDGSSPHGD